MKVRKGFVSNSSSSSFICDLTGADVSGKDLSLNECDMVQCINNHIFFYEGYPMIEEWINSDENEEYNYSLPAELCPICNGEAKHIVAARMKDELKRLKLTPEDVA